MEPSATYLLVALCFIGGFAVGAMILEAAVAKFNKRAEKAGVWVIEDRAYKLTRIQPDVSIKDI